MSFDNIELGPGSCVRHPEFGAGVVMGSAGKAYVITFLDHGRKEIAKTYDGLEVTRAVEPADDLVSLADVERTLVNILRRWSDISEVVHIAPKWRGGKLIMQPGDTKLTGKEVPIDQLFNKIVMVRDRLRVLEQRVNSSAGLSDEEKVTMQQYITRSYGSLTTFNILFRDAEDHFVGERGAR